MPICVQSQRSPDEGGVYCLVRMPPGPGPGEPLLGVTDGGVDPPVEHHLHPSVGLVRELPGNFILTKKSFRLAITISERE